MDTRFLWRHLYKLPRGAYLLVVLFNYVFLAHEMMSSQAGRTPNSSPSGCLRFVVQLRWPDGQVERCPSPCLNCTEPFFRPTSNSTWSTQDSRICPVECTGDHVVTQRGPAKSSRSQVLPPQSMQRRALISLPIHWGGTNSKANTNKDLERRHRGRERADCGQRARESQACCSHHPRPQSGQRAPGLLPAHSGWVSAPEGHASRSQNGCVEPAPFL